MVTLLLSGHATADDPGPAGSTQEQLEPVMVTAQHRAESAADIGVTVTSFSGAEADALGFRQPKDIASQTPGLSIVNATSGETPIFAIRGIGLDDFDSNNSGGVAVYVDDVLAAYPVFLNGQLFDMERIEVLKGPQGTLYGKNTTGGAINYISTKPSADFDAYVTAGYSEYDTYSVKGAVGGALADGINGRFAYDYDKGDGWQRDIHTGEAYGSTDKFALRGLLSVDLGGGAGVLFNVHYSMDKGTPLSPQNSTEDAVLGVAPNTYGIVSNDARLVNVGAYPLERDEQGYGASATLNVPYAAFSLTSITAVDRFVRTMTDNFDGTALALQNFAYDDSYDVASEEVRLTSRADSGFKWVAGVVGSYDKIDGGTSAQVADLFAVPDALFISKYVQNTTSAGVYLNTETQVTDPVRFIVGARYSYDRRSFDGGTIDADGFFGPPGGYDAFLDESHVTNDVMGKVGIEYKPSPQTLWYANVSSGYKTGVFYAAPTPNAQALAYVAPEKIYAYELGFKGRLLRDTLEFDAAAYHYDYRDRQSLLTFDSEIGVAATLGNIPKSSVNGGEIELRWVTPIPGLKLRLGGSFIDSEVLEAPSDVRGLPLDTPISKGDVLPQSPRWSYNGVASYERDAGGGYRAVVDAEYNWVDRQISALGDPNAGYGPNSSLRLRLALKPRSDRWTVSVWMDNVTNESAISYGFSNSDGTHVLYRQIPRWTGGDVTFKF